MAKRIQISQHGAPEVMQLVDFDPADPAAGEVQVENKAIGINYIDVAYVRSGFYPALLPSGLHRSGRRGDACWPRRQRTSRVTAWCTRNPPSVPTAKCITCR